ncbi:MAG: universal stress protein [Flavobacteriales bacterium]
MFSRILFPTALQPEENAAFRTALRLALTEHGAITLLHVGDEDREHVPWERYPPVRKTLERWGVLAKDSAMSDVYDKLGIEVRKLAFHASDVATSVQEHMERHRYDLVVMGTEARSSWSRWLRPSKAEPIAEAAHKPALFLPVSGRSPLQGEKDQLVFKRLLLPVGSLADVTTAVPAALAMAERSTTRPVDITLLHVGAGTAVLDQAELPDRDGVVWHRELRDGQVQDRVVELVQQLDIDLVVMATNGTDSLKDDLFGTTTERILRAIERPLLAVPHAAT